jgi:hypothetical protein
MPVIIPKQAPPPVKLVESKPPPQAAPGLTRADVEAMLAERDAMWERHLNVLIASLQPPPAPPAPRKGATISFTTDLKGQISGAVITPNK